MRIVRELRQRCRRQWLEIASHPWQSPQIGLEEAGWIIRKLVKFVVEEFYQPQGVDTSVSRYAGLGFGYKQHVGRSWLDNKDSVSEMSYRKISGSKYLNVKEIGEKSIDKKEVGKECTDGGEAWSKRSETKESWRKISIDTKMKAKTWSSTLSTETKEYWRKWPRSDNKSSSKTGHDADGCEACELWRCPWVRCRPYSHRGRGREGYNVFSLQRIQWVLLNNQ